MRFDRTLPVAVFLGPSLDHEAARAILPGNYYPPVRMGDVYRLVTCGVQLIVIIDGVFHRTTPVWQREIVSAINNGITVVGASSMGALRAVELESLGMTGVGTIVDWYRSGRIEGDDEVALQHADAEYGYRALSEPLVNIRWNLDRAASAGVLTTPQRDSLTAAMQGLDHERRSYPALYEHEAFVALDAATRRGLRTYLSERGENLKQSDARAALTWCAARLPRLLDGMPRTSYPGRAIRRVDELLLRGIPAPDHALPTLQELMPLAAADRARTVHIVNHASHRFYLLAWAATAGVEPPDDVIDAFATRWAKQQQVVDPSSWLSSNGLTGEELRTELRVRAIAAWLLEVGPQGVGLDRPFLEAWADQMGIVPPESAPDGAAFRSWLVERTPVHFGFDQWSADLEFVRELQLTGDVARLAAGHGASAQAVAKEADARAV